MKKLLLLSFFTFYVLNSLKAQDSCQVKISLLTCSPGEELYSTFGHTALRVQDRSAGTDLVFNYGTFDFSPDFYSKFIRGKLLYYLSVEDYRDFIYLYQMESRSIQEQVLQLNCAETQKLVLALDSNAQPQNRFYRYDFLFDNCTTRAGEIVEKNTASPVVYKNILPGEIPTFRHLIHSYLDKGRQHWSKLGIDILLGAPLDRRVSNKQAMFLPDYLLKGFDSASTGGRQLVSPPQTILAMPSPLSGKKLFTPSIVFSALLLLIVSLSFLKAKWATLTLSAFDFLLFFTLGLAGILLIFMWFGTDHAVCRNNYNLLWALPTNVIAAFFVGSRKKWVQRYFRLVLIVSVFLLLAWWFLPQQMNKALIPVVILIIFRSWHLAKKNNNARETDYHKR